MDVLGLLILGLGLFFLGMRQVGEGPRAGAHGTRVVFIHPPSAHGVLVELVQIAHHQSGGKGGPPVGP